MYNAILILHVPRTEHPLQGLAGCPTRTEKDQQRAEAGVDAWIKPDAEPLSQIVRVLDFQNVRFSDSHIVDCQISKMSDCQNVIFSNVWLPDRDQREWVFEVRGVKSENKKLSLFFEKCKVKKNVFTLFREVQSEKNAFNFF